MQPLRVFSIIIAVLIIIASSSNTSFKPGNEVNDGVDKRVYNIIDSILLLSIDDKPIFSSLLQTISAEEQVQQEVNQEEDGKDSDSVMEREEEQDRGQSERESSMGQEQEQQDREEEHIEDGIKENCRHEEHFDSGIDSCMPDEEKVCDDDTDNDNDGKVDLEDLDCLHNNKDDEVQQQNNKVENEDKEKLPGKEESSLDYEKDNNDTEKPVLIVEKNNNTSSSDSHVTESKAQNNSQNLTNSHSIATTTSNDNASLNRSHHYANGSAPEDSFTLNCDPAETIMVPGAEGSITCIIGNMSPNPIDLMIGCSGLEGTGIECSINGERSTRTTLAKEMSNTNFSVSMVSASSPAVPPGSYPFIISAEGT